MQPLRRGGGAPRAGVLTGDSHNSVMATPVSPEVRHRLIAEAAWHRYQVRNCAHGHHVADWLDAEREVDARLHVAAQPDTHGFLVQARGRDNLALIEGIGPKIAELLVNAGIATFAALAATRPAVIQGILDRAGPHYALAVPTTWPKQAGLAARGAWGELRRWQDELIGGRPG